MRLIRCVPALLAAALGCQAAPPPDTSASAKQAIDAANAQWPRLTSSGHADSIAEFYAADAVIMPPNMATMRGKDAVRAFFATINTIDALGTAKRTLAHGGRRLEQRLAIAHGSSCACAGTGATVRRSSRQGRSALPQTQH